MNSILKTLMIIVLFCNTILFAQEDEKEDTTETVPETFIGTFIALGSGYMDFDKFNNAIEAAGYNDFIETPFSIGFGLQLLLKRAVIGGEWNWLKWEDGETAKGATDLSAFYGLFDFGFNAIRPGRVELYPLFGIGGGHMKYQISEGGDRLFADIIAEPDSVMRPLKFRKSSFLLSAGVGANLTFKRKGREGYSTIGLRAGYRFDLLKDNWELDNDDIEGDPDARLSGAYFIITLGGASPIRNEKEELKDEVKREEIIYQH